jgi:hypothetical protein
VFSLRIHVDRYGDPVVELETTRRTMGGFWLRCRKRWLPRPRNPVAAAWTPWQPI